MKKNITIIVRILLGLIFFCSGMSKLFFEHRFPDIIGTVMSGDEVVRIHLVSYARFVAASQIVIGLLLFTQRFATLGAILLFPMLFNLFMLAFFLEAHTKSYVNFALLSTNLYLLLADYHKIKFVFSDGYDSIAKVPFEVRKFPFHDLVFLIGVAVVLISPFVSYIDVWLAYALAAFGLLTCIGIHLYDKNLRKEIMDRPQMLS